MNLLQTSIALFRVNCPSCLMRFWQPSPEKNAASAMADDSPAKQMTGRGKTTTSVPLTPLTWLETIPSDMSLVVYIDQASVQIMEVVAVSRKLASNLFGIPQYTGKHGVWQTVGQFNLRRRDFSPATAFQQQEDALTELESLLSARWHASSHLAQLDQAILAATGSASPLSSCGEPNDDACATVPIDGSLRDLLQKRQFASDEAARIDGTVIAAFQRIGVALPADSPGAGPVDTLPPPRPATQCAPNN